MSAEIVAFALQDRHYKSVPDRMFAIADAFNEEYHELADAGCPVIQIEEPQIHLIAVRKIQDKVINAAIDGRGVQSHREGAARQDRSLGAFLLGQSRRSSACSRQVQSYKPALETYNTVDADVITFESSSSGGIDLEAIGKTITEKKIAIGVIDHHTLQVESPDEVAAQIRAALKYIPPERLVISSDCGMGREGMSRRHAFYKIVSLVLGTNIVRKELGFPRGRMPGRRRALFAGGADEVGGGGAGPVRRDRPSIACPKGRRADALSAPGTLARLHTRRNCRRGLFLAPRPLDTAPHGSGCRASGEVAERLKAPHSKCGIRATVSGVRIPPSPPILSA